MLSVLAEEMTVAEVARREKGAEQSIGRWKADFLEAGKTALAAAGRDCRVVSSNSRSRSPI